MGGMRALTLDQVQEAGKFAVWHNDQLGIATTLIFVPGRGPLYFGVVRSEDGSVTKGWKSWPSDDAAHGPAGEKSTGWYHLPDCDCEFCTAP